MSSAGRAKFALLSHGLRISPGARELLTCGGSQPITIHDYVTTSGVILRLPDDVYVNAPFGDASSGRSPYTLEAESGQLWVEGPDFRVAASHVPLPQFLFQKAPSGRPFRELGITHTDRVRVSPVAGCAYRCRFCDLPYAFRYETKAIPDLVATLRAGLADPVQPASHALVSGGTPTKGDRTYFRECVAALTKATDAPVDAMMVPWPDRDYLADFAESGLRGLFFNIELFGQSEAQRWMPQKARLGREFFLSKVEEATRAFPKGQVSSLVIVGLEPLELTLGAVEALAQRGCVPILSPFRPSPATPLADHALPSEDTLVKAWTESGRISRRYGIDLGPRCVDCQHNTLTLPPTVSPN